MSQNLTTSREEAY